MMDALRKLANNQQGSSLAAKWRRKRFVLFESLVSQLGTSYTVLDVGGTEVFWEVMGFAQEPDTKVVLLNVHEAATSRPNFTSTVGDARNMSGFKDNQFDVVFSNSVIEHVGGYDDQRLMADEIRRVGMRYFVQTPNRFFPIEPHFLFPFFQFLPLSLKVFLVRHFDLGFYARGAIPDKRRAVEIVSSIRLLTERELRNLFPEGTMYKEKLFGMTKSFIVYCGMYQECIAKPSER
jgi:hypothetical protein